MKRSRGRTRRPLLAVALGSLCACACAGPDATASAAAGAPRYEVEAGWPGALPNDWILGQVAGIAVDGDGHVWVLHRPRTLTEDEAGATLAPPRSKCCVPAPAVLELDAAGNVLRSWGGPGAGWDWPQNEHGISIDPDGNVWIGGNGAADHQVLKFTADGEFLLQIGRPGESGGSNDTLTLGRPAHMVVDGAANDLFVADGYQNRRVIVFDATTGAYRRHWGAYGGVPDDAAAAAGVGDPDLTGAYDPAATQFGNPVHCVRLIGTDLLFVCDRGNNRIQVFRRSGEFVREIVLEPATRGSGSTWDLFPADAGQTHLLVADGTNNEVHVVEVESGERVGSFGRAGRNAGQFHWVHNLAVDARGNVYTTEVDNGKRVQKFLPLP